MTSPLTPQTARIRSQRGNVLFISLVLLTVLTVIGLSSLRTAITEEKIALAIQDGHLAMTAAENGLRIGQRLLKAKALSLDSSAYYNTVNNENPPPDLVSWAPGEGEEHHFFTVSSAEMHVTEADEGITQPLPKYKLERFAKGNPTLDIGDSISEDHKNPITTTYYRVISRGVGLEQTSEVILESILVQDRKH